MTYCLYHYYLLSLIVFFVKCFETLYSRIPVCYMSILFLLKNIRFLFLMFIVFKFHPFFFYLPFQNIRRFKFHSSFYLCVCCKALCIVHFAIQINVITIIHLSLFCFTCMAQPSLWVPLGDHIQTEWNKKYVKVENKNATQRSLKRKSRPTQSQLPYKVCVSTHKRCV